MADLQQPFQLGQQMQGRLQQLQSELANRTIETSSGGDAACCDRGWPRNGARRLDRPRGLSGP